MPLKRCQSNGESGWKWGDEGKCYTGENAKEKAVDQAIAMGEGDRLSKSEAESIKKRLDEYVETDEGDTMSNLLEKFGEFLNEHGYGNKIVVDGEPLFDEQIEEDEEETTEKGASVSGVIGNMVEQISKSREDKADLIKRMADAADVTRDTVRKTINGEVECPPRENLISFAEVLETNPNNLIRSARMDGCNQDFVKGVGPRGGKPGSVKIAFIGASPSKVDTIRNKAFSGKMAKTLRDDYLSKLDVEEDEVVFMNLVPEYKSTDIDKAREPTQEEIEEWSDYLKYELKKYSPNVLVALGTTARDALEKMFGREFSKSIDEFVPHPRAVVKHGASDELDRKFSRLNDTLETIGEIEKFEEESQNEGYETEFVKADDEQQVVKGIVIEPEVEDTDGNWTTREEIEKAAHKFLKDGNMTVGHEHFLQMPDSYVVESHITEKDQEINGQEVKEGSWVVGIKVEDPELWKAVKKGRYGGFSIGGDASFDPSKRLQ